MQSRKTNAVLWDMDGVIVDTAEAHFRSWRFAFQKRGVNFTLEDFNSIFGQRNDTIIRKIMGNSVTQSQIEIIGLDKEQCFRDLVQDDLKPFPGVVGLLHTLKENGISSAIASSAPLENIQIILNKLKIEEYFQALVYGQEVSQGKPDPEVFLLAAQKVGALPAGCIVIEDAVAGVEAAKRAGMFCIGVTNTHPANALIGADLVVDSLENIQLADLNKVFSKEK
jgi:beta-phosphoglucomutase family hydrolase